ncbi:MAG TPA: hemolysin family protein [Anaerolineales bacterium]|nr:hemolysin family protein [Anaerolineales bacterium]
MTEFTRDLIIIVVLLVLNGILAMTETALLAVRLARLHNLAKEGNKKALAAIKLAENPNKFLSTIQVGITLIDVMTGAIGGATLAFVVSGWFSKVPQLKPYSDSIGLFIVIGSITFLSIIFGELVPKRLAIQQPEKIASLMAGPMALISGIMTPIVRFLSASTNFVLKLLGVEDSKGPLVTEEEIQVLLDQGTQAGIFEEVEQDMVQGIFSLNDRRLSSLMTPRSEITWLDVNDQPDIVVTKIAESPYSRLPVCKGELDHILGVVKAKDVLLAEMVRKGQRIKELLQPAFFLPESAYASHALAMFRKGESEVIFIIDEFGVVQGLVTIVDIVSEIIGEFANDSPQAVQRPDGSWLLDGMLPIEDFKTLFDLGILPSEKEYETLAGFILILMGRIPRPAEEYEWNSLKFEIMDMDGNRVDKVLVSREQNIANEKEQLKSE